MADSGLNAQCLRRERFLRVNSCGSKRTFEQFFGLMFHSFSVEHICFNLDIRKLYFDSGVSMVIVAPLIQLLGSGKRLVIRDSEIYVFEMFGVFKSLPFRADGLDILAIEVL